MVLRAGRPLVLHAHGGYFDSFIAVCRRRCAAPSTRILQRANVLIALSSRWRDFYVNECELSPSQVVVLPNPVRWSPDVPDRTGRSHVQFLFLGRMCEKKGTLRSRERIRRAARGGARARAPGARRRRRRRSDRANSRRHSASRCACCRGSTARNASGCSRRATCSCCLRTTKACRCRCSRRWPRAARDRHARGRNPRRVAHGVGRAHGRARQRVADLAPRWRGRDRRGRRAARGGRRAHERARAFEVHMYARRLADIYQRIAPVAESGRLHERGAGISPAS